MWTLREILETILYSLLGMLGASILAFLLIRLKKWIVKRKEEKASKISRGKTLQDHIDQMESIHYTDQQPSVTQRQFQKPQSKLSQIGQAILQKSLQKAMKKGIAVESVISIGENFQQGIKNIKI